MEATNNAREQGAAVARAAILEALGSQDGTPAVELFRIAHQGNPALDFDLLQSALLSLLRESSVLADNRLRVRRVQLTR